MNLWDYLPFRRTPPTASLAKERLQIIINHERSQRGNDPDYLSKLQSEIIAGHL